MKSIFKLTQQKQDGQVLVLAIVVVGIIMVNTIALIGGSTVYSKNTDYSVKSQQALDLAEAGVDKAFSSLNSSGGSYTGENETFLGAGSYTVSVSSIDSTTKQITATGYIPSKAKAISKKTITIRSSVGTGASFNYGVQVGDGGLSMSNNAVVVGSVYANSSITMSNNAQITGDAYVAGGISPTSDQQSDCSGANCSDFIFGKTVGSNVQLDIAQSFKPASTLPINKVSLKLKKVGNPINPTVRILSDNSGKPNKNGIIASGTLSANLVGNVYGFVDIVMTTNPTLTAGTTYWIVIDTSTDSSNYWDWSLDVLPGDYTNGSAAWSPNWNPNNTPVWTSIIGDLGFKTWMGGTVTSITGTNGSTIGGEAHANTLNGLAITKAAYYQTQSNITVNGSNCNSNPKCFPNSTDPVSQVMPISDSNIADWEAQALANGSHTGDITGCPASIPSEKIIGNITLSNSCTTTVNTPIWVTGNITLNNNITMKMNPSYGLSSGVIIVDNFANLANGNNLLGSGTAGSYLLLISNFNSRDDPTHRVAINFSNSGNTGIVYSNLGSINLSNNNNLTEMTAWQIILSNNVTITYSQGLASMFFSAGPSGSFNLIKGTYQQK